MDTDLRRAAYYQFTSRDKDKDKDTRMVMIHVDQDSTPIGSTCSW